MIFQMDNAKLFYQMETLTMVWLKMAWRTEREHFAFAKAKKCLMVIGRMITLWVNKIR